MFLKKPTQLASSNWIREKLAKCISSQRENEFNDDSSIIRALLEILRSSDNSGGSFKALILVELRVSHICMLETAA